MPLQYNISAKDQTTDPTYIAFTKAMDSHYPEWRSVWPSPRQKIEYEIFARGVAYGITVGVATVPPVIADVKTGRTSSVATVGSPEWEPTADELISLVQKFLGININDLATVKEAVEANTQGVITAVKSLVSSVNKLSSTKQQ